MKTVKTVYLAMRNADITEGRGPMVIDCGFTEYGAAAEYIDFRPGVMGRVDKWSKMESGDWEIKAIPVYDCLADIRERELGIAHTSALAKLTDLEIEAIKELGI